MWAELCEERLEILKPYVEGRRVWDLGCGHSRGHADSLLSLGAREIHLVDKLPIRRHRDKRVHLHSETYFKDIEALSHEDVAFVSFPQTYAPCLGSRVRDAGTIIYIGLNDFMTACGDAELWRVLISREPEMIHEQDHTNRMIVYSAKARTKKHHVEEVTAIESVSWGKVWA